MNGISITPEGEVSKAGQPLGTIRDGIMYHPAAISGVVKGQIKDVAQNPQLKFVIEVPAPKPPVEGGGKTETPPITLPPAAAPFNPEPPQELTVDELRALADKHGFALIEKDAEQPPVIDPGEIVTQGRAPRWALATVLARADAGKIPAPPPMGPYGDKTPEFIEWFRTYASAEEFEVQYGGRLTVNKKPRPDRLPGEVADTAD